MPTPLETLFSALEQFSNANDSVREEGYSKLVDRSRPFLHALLTRSLSSEADRDDVIQEVFQRVWKSRERLEFSGVGSWWRFLRTMARNCTVDYLRANDCTISLEDLEMQDIPQDEQLDVDRLVEAMEDRRQLYRLADEAFLAVPSEKPDRLVNSELLAAKLLLVDRLPWQTVCRIVNSGRNDDEQLGRNDLDRLLSEPHVIRQLVYSELHWDNDKLCDLLLHRPTHNGKEAWTDHEVVAIQLRFQYVMLLEQIVPRLNGRLKKTELIAIFDSCVASFPFVEIMYRMNRDVGSIKGAREQLVSRGLWNRLVFQYFCHNALTHRDIHERIAPAGEVVGYEVTLAMLNVGLSNGRLFKQLAIHLAEKGA